MLVGKLACLLEYKQEELRFPHMHMDDTSPNPDFTHRIHTSKTLSQETMIPNAKFVRLVSIDEDINLSAQMEPISCGILPYDPSYTSQQYHIFFQMG